MEAVAFIALENYRDAYIAQPYLNIHQHVHRNMPKDQAMNFVTGEFERVRAERHDKEPGEIVTKAAEMADDYLEREKHERHTVPFTTRHLLHLLADGLHLYPEELGKLAEYIRSRQDRLQDPATEGEEGAYPGRRKILPSGLGKPPPLLPTPSGSHVMEHPPHPADASEHPSGPRLHSPGPYPASKPPPLLSMQGCPVPPHGPPPHGLGPRGPPPHRGPPPPRGPAPVHAFPLRGAPPVRGPSPHGGPPSLKSLKMGEPLGRPLRPGGPPRPGLPRH